MHVILDIIKVLYVVQTSPKHSIGNESKASLCVHAYRITHVNDTIMPASQFLLRPIKTMNWLVAASKLRNDNKAPCCTAEWPYCPLLMLWPK